MNQKKVLGSNSYSASCIIPPPDYDALCREDKLKFGKLVHQLRTQRKCLEEAQNLAYHHLLNESIPFEPTGK